MMNEDDKIIRMCGKENPFKVPEGYFEAFTERLMKSLPAVETPAAKAVRITLWQRVKPWLYMAAMFGGLIAGFRLIAGGGGDTQLPDSEARNRYMDEYIESVIDNSMMDDYTIYCYLTGADGDTY